MASCWPDGGEPLLLDAAHGRLLALCNTLESGLRMPNTAQRLLNVFETSDDLHRTLDNARRLSVDSPALKCEQWRKQWLSSDQGLARAQNH